MKNLNAALRFVILILLVTSISAYAQKNETHSKSKSKFELLSPEDNAKDVPVNTQLIWSSSEDAVHYKVELAEDKKFNKITIEEDVTETSIYVTGLEYKQEYYWRVTAYYSKKKEKRSKEWSFTTEKEGAINAPQLISPADKEKDVPVDTELIWTGSDGAEYYKVELGADKKLHKTLLSEEVTGTSLSITDLEYKEKYYWRVTAFNSEGKSKRSKVWSFYTEKEPQIGPPLLISPEDNAVNVPVSTQLVWNEIPEADHYKVEVKEDGKGKKVVYDKEVYGTTYELTGLKYNQLYTWRVKAYLSKGSTKWSEKWSFTTGSEVSAPQLTIIQPENNLITNTTPITVSGTVDDPNHTVTVNGVSVTVNSDSSFSAEVDLVEGSNSITIEARNYQDDVTTETRNVIFDSIPPQLTVTAPEDNTFTNLTFIDVTGTVTDASTVTLTINSDTVQVISGSFTHQVSLVDGANAITITAVDEAGNSTTETRNVTLDTAPPVLSITAPDDNSFTNLTLIDVIGTVTDASNIILTMNSDTVQVTSGSFTNQPTLADGLNTITITASDEAGNTSTETRNVTLDTAPPVLTVTAPDDNTFTNLTLIDVTGTVTDASNVTLTVNSDTVQVIAEAFTHQDSLAVGLNTITITAVDEAGNSTTETRNVTLDTAPPVLTVTAPDDNTFTNLTLIDVTGTVTDAADITLTVNSDTVQVLSGAFTHQVALAEGLNTITVSVIDEAGNRNTKRNARCCAAYLVCHSA
ncbi:hypothetical protein ACFLTH_10180 [Bacteroidota bacterium]